MERQKITIKRPPSSGLTPTYGSIPCSGGTNYWPINTSYDCSGITMYNSTYSMVDQALSGDMSTFPQELMDCSITNPCIILWDTIYIDPTTQGLGFTECISLDGHLFMMFMGLKATSASTITTGSYNEIIDIYQITDSDIRLPLHTQVAINLTANMAPPCNCVDYLAENLSQVTVFLSQDFNDIGHYSMWDGNVEQKDIFNNFVFSSMTSTGWDIRVTNTTDFGYYKTFQDSPFTISWMGCDCADPICFGGGGCETLLFPNLTGNYSYPPGPPMQRKIIITQDTPWGKSKTSKVITTPALSYASLMVAYPPTPVLVFDTIGNLMYTTDGGGPQSWGPLDSGIDINSYSANSPTPCFEFSGVSESILGAFQTYSSAIVDPNLGAGFVPFIWVPIGGDVVNPLDGSIQQGMQGKILNATPAYTAYTITSTGLNNTPIDFYDFSNGITIFVATSCGINASMFGGAKCAPCPDEDCVWCETKDEYVDRVTFTPTPIAFNTNQGQWSQFVDYAVGDIVYDVTYNTCCCFMAVHSIDQTSSTPDPWAAWPPATLLSSGIWQGTGGTDTHIWEACSPDCVACPPGTQTPCNDASIWDPAITIMTSAGPQGMWGGVYIPGNNYYIGQFVEGPNGDCFQALTDMIAPAPSPTALTNSSSWDYIGCVSWVCPTDLGNPGPLICEMISGQTPNSFTFYGSNQGCIYSYNGGECSADTAWYCLSGCSGCTELEYTDPLYFTLGPIGNGVLFDSQTGCTVQCDPDAWSCSTPTGGPCCTVIGCAADWAAGISQSHPYSYTSIMTNIYSLLPPSPLPDPPTWIANNFDVWVSPYFNQTDCESGCCDTTGYFWTCDQGCQLTPGQTMTLAECEYSASTGVWSYGIPLTAPYTGVCGYNCVNPFIPFTLPLTIPPLPGTTPCEPCFNGFGCGNYSTLPNCISSCTDCHFCWSCDETQPGCPCEQHECCPTLSGAPNPLGIYGPNPLLGTYATEQECNLNCPCDGGWDCWLEDDGTGNLVSIGFCASADTFWQNNQGWTPSPGGIYNSLEECCSSTTCCMVFCEGDQLINPGPSPSNPVPPLGNYPCMYDQFGSMTSFCYTYNPVIVNPGIPYCTMLDCTLDNPNGTCEEPGCECACSGVTGGVVNDMGSYDSMFTNYQQDDIVAWADPSDPLCCYVCTCTFNFGFYDCNDPANTGIPGGDPFAPNGTPNCWEKCLKTPGLPPLGCQTCLGSVSGSTYECTVDGCENSIIVSGIPCIAPTSLVAQTAQNCYTSSTCNSECMASCYCGDLDSDPSTIDETGCVVEQDWLNNTNVNTIAPPYPTYAPVPAGIFNPLFPFASYNDCMALFPALDCCPSGQTWYCDSLQNCSSNSSNPGGCYPIPPGDPLYPGPFTSLDDCEDWCTWECDSSGWQQCIFNANTPPGPTTYNSAYQCWQNTNDCFCNSGVTASTWYCDEAGVAAGLYASPGDSPCVTDTFIASQTWTYQSQAWGIGGPPFGNFPSTGFPTQADCQNSCRWCCDVCPVGTCFCDNLAWNQTTCSASTAPSAINIYDCITNTNSFFGYYPCSAATVVVWYCDAVNGCSSYNQASPPLTYASGPYYSSSECTEMCNFICGPCEPGGFSTCACNFINAIIPLTCNTYTDMSTCLASVPPLLFFADDDYCCTCYECVTNVSVTFQVWNGTSWALASQNINPMTVGAEPWVASSSPLVNDQGYQPGDVVTFNYDLQTCCYVNVYSGTGVYWDIDPYYYYTIYLGNVTGNQPTFLGPPSGMPNPNTGTLVWVPCDDNCIIQSGGYWVCDSSNSPTCFCTFDPLATAGYSSLGQCESDVSDCCYIPPTGFWVCEQPALTNCFCNYDPNATSGWATIGDCETDLTNNNCCYIPPVNDWKCITDNTLPYDNDCAAKTEFDITNRNILVGFEDSFSWPGYSSSGQLYTNTGGGLADVNDWTNFSMPCWPNAEVAIQALVLSYGVGATFSNYKFGSGNGMGSSDCSTQYQNIAGCCSTCDGTGTRTNRSITSLHNLSIDAINGQTTTFTRWIDYINGAIAAGVPANYITGLPPGTGVMNGYLVGLQSLNALIYDVLNYGQYPCPGGMPYCDKIQAPLCCQPPCLCVEDVIGNLPGIPYLNAVLCSADTTNCCGEEPDPQIRYDCVRNSITKLCDCIPTKNGPYPTIADCQLAGQMNPPQNCCSASTSGTGFYVCTGHNIPACTCIFSGTATAGYTSMTDCQQDPLTCCYKPQVGFYICNPDCGCQWDSLASNGYPSLLDCQNDPLTCCYTANTPDYISCEKTAIIGPPGGNNVSCNCVPNPLCTSPGPNCYTSMSNCLTDTTNCCGHQGYKTYDCDPIMGCYNPFPSLGFFTGPAAFTNCTTALSNNTAPCNFDDPVGCEDCDINLASSLGGPMQYMGVWDAALNYQLDECISIPATLFDTNCGDKILVTSPPYPQSLYNSGAVTAVELLFSLPAFPAMQGTAFAQYKFEVGPVFGQTCKGPNGLGLAFVSHITINSGPLVDPQDSLYSANLAGMQAQGWSDLLGYLNNNLIHPMVWWCTWGWGVGVTAANNSGYPHDYTTIHDYFLSINTDSNGVAHDWTVHWDYCICKNLECCYCCVKECVQQICPAGWSWSYIQCKCLPPIIQSLTSPQEFEKPLKSKKSATLCNAGYFPPEHLNVTLPNAAHWEACNVNVDNTPANCEEEPVDVCQDDCYTHLQQYMFYYDFGGTIQQSTLIFKPWSAYYHYGTGQCVVDPNDGCCYCCVSSPNGTSPGEFGAWTPDPTSGLQPCSLYGGQYWGNVDHLGNYFGWMSCTDTGVLPCTGTNNQMWGCLTTQAGPTVCVIMGGGQFTSQTECYQQSNCTEPPKGFFVCKGGGPTWPSLTSDSNQSVAKKNILAGQSPCNCVWDANATSGYVTYSLCASDANNCCKCEPPQGGCPQGQSWNQSICACQLPSIQGPVGALGETVPCIQTEECGAGWNWNWELCKCISSKQSGSGNAAVYN